MYLGEAFRIVTIYAFLVLDRPSPFHSLSRTVVGFGDEFVEIQYFHLENLVSLYIKNVGQIYRTSRYFSVFLQKEKRMDYHIRFQESETLKERQEIVKEMMGLGLPEFDEDISEFSEIVNDEILEIKNQENLRILNDIDEGKYGLYRCVVPTGPFRKSEEYRVRIDDMKSELMESWKDNMTEVIEKYINSIVSVVWIVVDDGLGTLKRKIRFDGNLEEHFIPAE